MSKNQPTLGDAGKILETAFGAPPGKIERNVVLTPFLPLRAFSRHADEGTLSELSPQFFFQGFTALFKGVPVSVIRTGVGPSRVGDAISLLSLSDAENLVFAGAVGALGEEFSLGDFFLPLWAANGEGYTRYLREPFDKIVSGAPLVHCNGGLEERTKKALGAMGIRPREGKVFTIGSIAVESPENLALLKEKGFDALEMELSAFYAAARHHGLRGAAITYVSDLPLKSSLWEEKSQEEKKALERSYRLLPEAALAVFSS